MDRINSILELARVFGEAREIGQARVSTLVFKDGKRLKSLESGSDIGARSADRAVQWFSDNWPDGAAWPESVIRPARVEAAA